MLASSNNYIHYMRLINPDECWKMLHEVVFRKECCPFELEVLGMLIATNYSGLPLLLILISGLLYKAQKTLEYWMYVEEKISYLKECH